MSTVDNKKRRLAMLVGCNYGGTSYELQGCINDVLAMRDALVGRFGFEPEDVVLMTDEAGAPVMPTGKNIKNALADMVGRAGAGDIIFFHYSGHGTLIPAVGSHSHVHRGDDEAIVPCDFNLITDVDFRELVNRLPAGATFTFVSDSCHSGGLIENEKEQIGPSAGGVAAPSSSSTARFIPHESVLHHLATATGIDSLHVGDHLSALFGADASAKFSTPHSGVPPSPRNDEGILLSGCQANETSADVAAEDAQGGKPCGAFSSALQAVLAAHPSPMTNREVVSSARRLLTQQGFDQHPCLYCSDANADAPFLWQPSPPVPATSE